MADVTEKWHLDNPPPPPPPPQVIHPDLEELLRQTTGESFFYSDVGRVADDIAQWYATHGSVNPLPARVTAASVTPAPITGQIIQAPLVTVPSTQASMASLSLTPTVPTYSSSPRQPSSGPSGQSASVHAADDFADPTSAITPSESGSDLGEFIDDESDQVVDLVDSPEREAHASDFT